MSIGDMEDNRYMSTNPEVACEYWRERANELEAELADTVTACLAAESNEVLLRKQLAFRSHLTQKEANVVCRENEAMKQQLAELQKQRGFHAVVEARSNVLGKQLAKLREAARAYLEMNNPVNSNKLEALLQGEGDE